VEEVGLSDGQVEQVDSIMNFYWREMVALHEEFDDAYNPRYREIQVASRVAVRGVLTTEQLVVYDSIRAVYDSIRGDWQRRLEERQEDSTVSSRAQRGEGGHSPRIP